MSLGSLFIVDGESSYTFDRPDFVALEKFIKEHKKKVKYLVVFDHDRFSRNLPEALQKIESLEQKHGLKVIATTEPLDIDTSDPSVFLLRAFRHLIASQELLIIHKRQSERKARPGIWQISTLHRMPTLTAGMSIARIS